jgi:hypothetical protein
MILMQESQKWRFVLHDLCISTYVYWVAPIAYWLSCHMLSNGRDIIKVCAI